MWYTYLVECEKNNAIYCGITNNLERRINQHNTKKGAKYTKIYGPVVLLTYFEHNNKSEAAKHEYLIKQLSRLDKLELIENFIKQ